MASRDIRRTITLGDVAAAAHVSVGTVSKALNGRGQLSSDTRERVLAAARDLGFRPNQLARGLVAGRSFIVGVISTDSYGRFTLPILTGAEDALAPGQISMLLCESRGDPIRERHYLDTLIGRRVDGLLVTGRSSNPRPPIELPVPLPVVYALAPSQSDQDVSVVPDDRGGAQRAVEHLLHAGRTRIAIVVGPAHQAASRHRAEGAIAALRDRGLEPIHPPLHGDWTEHWGREAAASLLAECGQVDGVLCGSDQIARGLLDGLRDAGVEVPSRVAVAGIDNWNVIAEAARPSLTSIDLNLRQVGRRSAELLLAMIEGEHPAAGMHQVECSLQVRQST